MIVGGSWRGSTWTAEDAAALPVSIGGSVTVTLGAGTYLGDIYGAGNCGTVGGDVLVSLTEGSVFGAEGEEGGIIIGGSAGATVGGDRTLELKGSFGATDFQHTTFTQFDKINVSGEGSSATIYALTDSPALTKTGAGDLKLGADAAEAETILGGITEGISIMEGSLNLSGADGSHMKGTLNIAAGSRLTGVTGSVTVGEGGLDRAYHCPWDGKHRPGYASIRRCHQQRQRNGKRPEPGHCGRRADAGPEQRRRCQPSAGPQNRRHLQLPDPDQRNADRR